MPIYYNPQTGLREYISADNLQRIQQEMSVGEQLSDSPGELEEKQEGFGLEEPLLAVDERYTVSHNVSAIYKDPAKGMDWVFLLSSGALFAINIAFAVITIVNPPLFAITIAALGGSLGAVFATTQLGMGSIWNLYDTFAGAKDAKQFEQSHPFAKRILLGACFQLFAFTVTAVGASIATAAGAVASPALAAATAIGGVGAGFGFAACMLAAAVVTWQFERKSIRQDIALFEHARVDIQTRHDELAENRADNAFELAKLATELQDLSYDLYQKKEALVDAEARAIMWFNLTLVMSAASTVALPGILTAVSATAVATGVFAIAGAALIGSAVSMGRYYLASRRINDLNKIKDDDLTEDQRNELDYLKVKKRTHLHTAGMNFGTGLALLGAALVVTFAATGVGLAVAGAITMGVALGVGIYRRRRTIHAEKLSQKAQVQEHVEPAKEFEHRAKNTKGLGASQSLVQDGNEHSLAATVDSRRLPVTRMRGNFGKSRPDNSSDGGQGAPLVARPAIDEALMQAAVERKAKYISEQESVIAKIKEKIENEPRSPRNESRRDEISQLQEEITLAKQSDIVQWLPKKQTKKRF